MVGSRLLRAALVGLLALQADAALGQDARVPDIDRDGVVILLRSTLLALDAANKTGNYTTFRDMAAPDFAARNSAAQLADIFRAQWQGKVDISGIAVIDPHLTTMPEVRRDGGLHMAGFFPSVPTKLSFDVAYVPVAGRWRLDYIDVDIGPSGPSAPVASDPPSAKAGSLRLPEAEAPAEPDAAPSKPAPSKPRRAKAVAVHKAPRQAAERKGAERKPDQDTGPTQLH